MDVIKVKCAIACDSNTQALGEIILELLPSEWRPHATLSICAQWNDVIEMVRSTLPALLVIHSNLFLLSPKDGIVGCIAVSPHTRYLLLTGWSEEIIDDLLKFHKTLPFSVLRQHFDREQLIAALEGAFGSST